MKTLSDSSMLNLNHATKLRMSPIAARRIDSNTNPDMIKSQKYLMSQGGGYGGDHRQELLSENDNDERNFNKVDDGRSD